MDYESRTDDGDIISVEAFDESDFPDDDIGSESSGNDKPMEQPDIATAEQPAQMPNPRRQQATAPILTLAVGAEVETQCDKEDAIWHEMKNSQVTGTHLAGILVKVEQLESGGLYQLAI